MASISGSVYNKALLLASKRLFERDDVLVHEILIVLLA